MAGMNIQYPHISEGNADTQIAQIKDYLFQLTDQLNLQDFSAERIFEDVSKAIDAEAVANGSNEQTDKLREYANLKALIIKTGDYANSHSETLKRMFTSRFKASSDFGEYDEELVQKVEENAEGINRLFDYTAGINNEDGKWAVGTKQFVKTGLLYYDEGQVPVFGVGVGVINKIIAENDTVVDMSQNQLATFAADEMAFWDNGIKVGYISGKKFHFPAADIRGGSIHIGEEKHNFFKVDESGNLQVGDYFSVSSAGLAKFQSANGKTKLDLTSGNLTFSLTNKLELEQSAEGIVFKEYRDEGDLTTINYIGGISAYLNPGMDDDFFYPTARLSVYDIYDGASSKTLGRLWDNGGTRSQLDVGEIYLRDGYDMNTEYGVFAFKNNAACLTLNQNQGLPIFKAYITDMGYSVVEVHDSNGAGLGVNLGVASGGGQFTVLNRGEIKGGMIASSNGAELRIGGGDSSWNMAWNKGEGSHLQADHHHFLGKSEGLFTGTVAVSECSAYVVIGRPTSGGYYSSVTIPSDIATGRTWQIADEVNYITFTISANGTVSQTGGSSGSGSIVSAYSIR